MAQRTFIIDAEIDIRITVKDNNGTLNFMVEVLETDGKTADLRGFFFNLAGNSAFPGPLAVAGDDVTGKGTNTNDLGQGVNVKGAAGKFDVGVAFGTPGIGKDDIQTTAFSVSGSQPLSVEDLDEQMFGVRLTSVGDIGGARGDSLKIVDVPECVPCEPLCDDVVIDFNDLAEGAVVSEISLLGGALTVTVGGERKAPASTGNDAMAFDADAALVDVSGEDPDLLGGDGKVLILSEDNDSSDPDDARFGGTFEFVFSDAVDLASVVIIDTEEGGSIEAFNGADSLGTVVIPNVGDGDLQTVDLSGFDGVTRLVVRFDGSGALDDLALQYCRPDPDCGCLL